ncbi:MAG TPA: universal stress protein [Methylomirabilota bacterium]|jgi:nucleotide-binding universal stress UspA family protein|nr:universal stress protein [Methylomirabilota bacterium]
MEIRTILVPCDFSDHSALALQWALGLAEQYRAKVVGGHVVHLLTPRLWKQHFVANPLRSDLDRPRQ